MSQRQERAASKVPDCSTHGSDFAESLRVARGVRAVDADHLPPHALDVSGPTQPSQHWVETLTTVEDEAAANPPRGPGTTGPPASPSDTTFDHPTQRHENDPHRTASFEALLANRRSQLLPGPVSRDLIIAALDHLGSNRGLDLDTAGRTWKTRDVPSAGGTHSIEPLAYVGDVHDMTTGWYRQEGEHPGHIGRVIVPEPNHLRAIVEAALRHTTRPAAIIYAIADPHLIHQRYPHGSSLLWRDAGCFLMTAHLLATAYGHSSSIVGITAPLPLSPPATSAAVAPGAAGASVDRADLGQDPPELTPESPQPILLPHAVGAVVIGGVLKDTDYRSDSREHTGRTWPRDH